MTQCTTGKVLRYYRDDCGVRTYMNGIESNLGTVVMGAILVYIEREINVFYCSLKYGSDS